MGRVVVVGSINTDLVARSGELPRPGETVLGSDFTIVGGGKGANAAVAAARLGASVAFVGCLGEDDFGRARLADLDREGIDTALICRSDRASSGVALIVVDAAGENTIVVVSGTNALVGPDVVTELVFAPGDLLLTQLELPLPTVEAALRRAREAGVTTVLNAAPYNPAIREALPFVDFLVLNEVEGADLLGWERVTMATAPEAIAAILARGVGAVALTLGAHGVWVGRGTACRHLPAPQVRVVDTTAAGDAFTGALAFGLAAGDDLFAAAERAVIVGSLTVTKAGAQPSLPYARDVVVGHES
jgi:ribokinase